MGVKINNTWMAVYSFFKRYEPYNFMFTDCTSDSNFVVMQMDMMDCMGVFRTQISVTQAYLHSHLMLSVLHPRIMLGVDKEIHSLPILKTTCNNGSCVPSLEERVVRL
jgi:hypothetical protein